MATARVLSFKGGAGLAPALREASRSKGWFSGPHTSAHTRWLVATAGVLSFKGGAGAGPRVEGSEPKQKVV